MRWRGARESANVEDRRGRALPAGRMGGLGCAGLLVILGISLYTGTDPRKLLPLLGLVEQVAPPPAQTGGTPPPDDPQAQFIARVLGSTEDVWSGLLKGQYREPTLVLFDGRVSSACGFASAAAGPFYCPGDQHVYLDLSFFRELDRRFGAPGDFAQAYVVAHEIGHHVQKLVGISDRVSAMQERAHSQEAANELSIRLELQADCFAGVWGSRAAAAGHYQLEPGDLEEGLRAASAIGDDAIQAQAQGYVVPESWTHGSSEMRVRWLRRGLESGDPTQCDTFKAPRL